MLKGTHHVLKTIQHNTVVYYANRALHSQIAGLLVVHRRSGLHERESENGE